LRFPGALAEDFFGKNLLRLQIIAAYSSQTAAREARLLPVQQAEAHQCSAGLAKY
jgi:hypothetical protein